MKKTFLGLVIAILLVVLTVGCQTKGRESLTPGISPDKGRGQTVLPARLIPPWAAIDNFNKPSLWKLESSPEPESTSSKLEQSLDGTLKQSISGGQADGRDFGALEATREFILPENFGLAQLFLEARWRVPVFGQANAKNGRADLILTALDSQAKKLGSIHYRLSADDYGGQGFQGDKPSLGSYPGLKPPDKVVVVHTQGEVDNWQTLRAIPTNKLQIDWSKISKLRVTFHFDGGFMYQDSWQIEWDELKLAGIGRGVSVPLAQRKAKGKDKRLLSSSPTIDLDVTKFGQGWGSEAVKAQAQAYGFGDVVIKIPTFNHQQLPSQAGNTFDTIEFLENLTDLFLKSGGGQNFQWQETSIGAASASIDQFGPALWGYRVYAIPKKDYDQRITHTPSNPNDYAGWIEDLHNAIKDINDQIIFDFPTFYKGGGSSGFEQIPRTLVGFRGKLGTKYRLIIFPLLAVRDDVWSQAVFALRDRSYNLDDSRFVIPENESSDYWYSHVYGYYYSGGLYDSSFLNDLLSYHSNNFGIPPTSNPQYDYAFQVLHYNPSGGDQAWDGHLVNLPPTPYNELPVNATTRTERMEVVGAPMVVNTVFEMPQATPEVHMIAPPGAFAKWGASGNFLGLELQITSPSQLTLQAYAYYGSDRVALEKLEFLKDGSPLGQDTTPSWKPDKPLSSTAIPYWYELYEYTWNITASDNGSHQIIAKAKGEDGRVAESYPLFVTVAIGGGGGGGGGGGRPLIW